MKTRLPLQKINYSDFFQKYAEAAPPPMSAAAPPHPVFVINLKRDTERLAFMQKQLDKINIPFEVIPAVDGASIPAEQLASAQLAPAALGCFLSHVKAWRTLLERDLPAALILEDDALLDDDFPEILRNLRLPAACQILQLISKPEPDGVRNRVFSPYGAMSLPHGWKMACSLGENYGTQAYIIRAALARRLLREEGRPQKAVDFILFNWTCNFSPPWIVYKKEKRGAYATLGEEKCDLGTRSISNDRRRRSIAKRIKNLLTDMQRAAADSAGDQNLPVLALNLKKDARRLEAMQRRFDAMGVSFETVEAIDGKRIPAQTMHKIYDGKRARRNLGRELSPAEIGRCLSHVKAHRALLNTDAPAAAIVEDNAVPDEDFPKFLRYSDNQKEASGNRTKHGVFRWKPVLLPPPPPPILLPHDYRPADDEEIKSIHNASAAVRRFQTQAYIIHRSRAQQLLRKERRIQRPVDDLLFYKKPGLRKLFLKWSNKTFWDAAALFNAHVLCRIFPPTRAHKLSQFEFDGWSDAGVWKRSKIKLKIMLSCYSLSRPFGLNLSHRKTGASAQE